MANTDKKDLVQRLIQLMRVEATSSQDLRATMELLIKITRNILPPKNASAIVNPKFKQINPANSEFNQKIWQKQGARKILLVSGWVRAGQGQNLRLVRSEKEGGDEYISVQELIGILIENRNITPAEDEWVPETKVEKILTSEEKFRLEVLAGAEKRKNDSENALKEKRLIKAMAELCKKEQRADQEYRQLKNPPIQSEAQRKAFEKRARGSPTPKKETWTYEDED